MYPTLTPSGQLPTQIPGPGSTPADILTTAPRQPEEISAIEKRAEAYGMRVKQFGYGFFYQPPATFLPVQQVPVGPDYVIGPEDTIRIVLWGSVQGEYSLTVDRNGQVSIPKVGVVQVSGLTFKQLREVLDREFTRQYTNFQMNVTLDNLRTIQVFVVGQARFPGSYVVSSLSTLISALFAAGGPSKSGTMRHIQVRRGGKVVASFDMYDFLLRGDKSKDIRLQSQDVIFIPPIGQVAAIGAPLPAVPPSTTGPVPQIQATPMAPAPITQGQPPTGPGAISPATPPVPTMVPLTPTPGAAMGQTATPMGPPPYPGLPPTPGMSPGMWGQAPLEPWPGAGNPVKIPGIYELKNEKTLTDLLNLAGGMGSIAFKGRVQVLRIQGRQEMVLFEDDLSKVITKRVPDVPLVDGDLVKIFPVPDLVERKVRIAGAVKTPGEFGLFDNMRVKDLVSFAGGLLREANKEEAEITRVTVTPQGPETTRLYVRISQALAGVSKENILLRPDDYLFIRTVPEWDLYKLVRVNGEVKFPGDYAIKKGETLSSLLARAGGLTTKSFPRGTFFTRVAVKETQARQLKEAIDRLQAEMASTSIEAAQTELDEKELSRQKVIIQQQQMFLAKLRSITPLGRVVIDLDDPERMRGTPTDIELQEGDTLMVPQIQQTVNVLGSVVSPTAVVYEPHITVKQYIARAGGPTKNADEKGTYIIKVNGSAVARRNFSFFGNNWDGHTYAFQAGFFSNLRLEPGDTIVVPEELERIAWLREIKDITSILAQAAVVAGVVLVGLRPR